MPQTPSPDGQDPLAQFSPLVREWFARKFGAPTPPQRGGWHAIQQGAHTLILAPTGSGKTLAAFLWGIDQRARELAAEGPAKRRGGKRSGVRILYISPLKALNNDVERNLRVPLAGIAAAAEAAGQAFPEIRVAVRSGDTSASERQAMVRRPPDILITTPESLYLMLTSPTARNIFREVRTVIVDEIHTLVGSKRGVHLSLSLERLAHLAEGPVQRIGLSATIRPLEEAARFLGGCDVGPAGPEGALTATPRPVTIVDAHYRKALDLRVTAPAAGFRNLPGGSVWPSLIPRVVDLVREHRSTLVFCNSRRLAERTADRMNEELAAGEQRQHASALIRDGVAVGNGIFAVGNGTHPNPIRAHHGSVSREARLQMEQDLKAGELPALVATSSLELGIDIGAVDLVVQIQAPESAARGLQRVGRSGHLVGQTSKARIFPTHAEDLVSAAAVAGAMLRGEVEPTSTPRNPLDVLAQQIVAMVSVETWEAEALYCLVRGAYAYQDLSPDAYRMVLEMLSGRYSSQAHKELRPRVAWDRVGNKLAALPGSRMLSLGNGGTIADKGMFGAYLSDGQTKLGELDEEFVYETRKGDVFMLGSQVWRVTDITDDRVVVTPAPGSVPRMPFWHGETPWRPYELGLAVGRFRREVVQRIRESGDWWQVGPLVRGGRPVEAAAPILDWLQQEHALDEPSAWQVLEYLASQLRAVGAVSSDQVIVVERFRDALGEPRLVIHCPLGGRINGPWGLALTGALREQLGIEVEVQAGDDGILLRFPGADVAPDVDPFARMAPAEARERVLRELPDSALFGSQFRQNAARSLLLPGGRPGKRTPFWLQRLRARELMQVVRRFGDFPVVVETYRDCLQDVMDLPHLEQLLSRIRGGEVQVVCVESMTPSPVAQNLLDQFTAAFFYDGDAPKAERHLARAGVDRALLQELLKDVALEDLLKPEAVDAVVGQLQRTAPTTRVRTAEELAVLLERVGDLSPDEVVGRSALDPAPWLRQLSDEGRVLLLPIPTAAGSERRWVSAEYAPEYCLALGIAEAHLPAPAISPEEAAGAILGRFLAHSGPVTAEAVRTRYAFSEEWLRAELERRVSAGELAHGRFSRAVPSADQFLERDNLEQMHRRTLALLRREVRPVSRAVFADFLARWQHAHPDTRLKGRENLTRVLQQLRAMPLPGRAWERDVLSARLDRYDPADLDALCSGGDVVWIGSGGTEARHRRVRFLFRGEGRAFLAPAPDSDATLSTEARSVRDLLQSEGAAFFPEIRDALGLDAGVVERALIELSLAGLVTNDRAESLRRLLTWENHANPASGDHRPASALEAQLAARMGRTTSFGRRPPRGEYQAAKRRVAERLGIGAATRWEGRWSLVHRLGVMGRELPPEERATVQARLLLQRWGVLTRDALATEEGPWDWAELAARLSVMEMRGEVRRGYFVEGLPGVQYALPEVVEQLRARRDAPPDDAEPPVILNACDPACLYGRAAGADAADGTPLAFSRLPSTWLAQWRGHPILLAESGGESLVTAAGAEDEVLLRCLEALARHLLRHEYRLTVHRWNGQPVLESGGRALLERVGFVHDYRAMTRERAVGGDPLA